MSNGDPRRLRIALAWYRLMLWFYPRAFRQTFGPEMLLLFQSWSRDAYRLQGSRGLGQVWLRMALDLVTSIPREHWAAAIERRSQRALARIATVKGAVMVIDQPVSYRAIIQQAIWRSSPVILGLLIQWSLWVIPSQARDWLGIEHCLTLLLITGLLIGYMVAINVLLIRRQKGKIIHTGLDDHHGISRWIKTVVVGGAILYLTLIVIMPTIIPHTARLHDWLWYNSGIAGKIYAFIATLTMLLKGVVLIPSTAGLSGQAMRVWRGGSRTEALRWLIFAGAVLLLAVTTRAESHAYSNWFMD